MRIVLIRIDHSYKNAQYVLFANSYSPKTFSCSGEIVFTSVSVFGHHSNTDYSTITNLLRPNELPNDSWKTVPMI